MNIRTLSSGLRWLPALAVAAGASLFALPAQAVTTVSTSSSYTNVELEPYQLPAGEDAVDVYNYLTSNSSSNSMFPARNEIVIVWGIDDQGDYSLLVIIDKRNDGSGGSATMDLTGALGWSLVVEDDDNDVYNFNGGTGVGFFSWNWLECCTDGMALQGGDEMPEDICLDFSNVTGINKMRFCAWAPGTSSWQELTNLQTSETICIHTEGTRTSDTVELATAFELGAAFPNPFNPTTQINFTMNETASATLSVFDMRGALVSTLVDGLVSRGEHSVTFDAKGLASGSYIYRLQSEGEAATGRMLLIK